MTREMLRAKIHRITVTEANIDYEGSITIDAELMRSCDMVPYEKVDVYDIENGNRFTTYLIQGPAGSGDCCVNGAAARLVDLGDKVIVCSYCQVEESEVLAHRPRVTLVGEGNRIKETKDYESAATLTTC